MLAVSLAGCSSPAKDTTPTDVSVFAAASLTESFTTLGRQFEASHRGTRVTFNFAGSAALATQINQGAPADVFASAASRNMATIGDAAVTPTTFVKNQLVIATAKGNPKHITGLAELAKPGLKVALCAAEVPCGAAAQSALAASGVKLTPVTLEQDVKAALSKVELGEVDAALVYRTDARTASAQVDAVEFPESAEAINEYPIAVLKRAANPTGAREFVDYVLSPEGTRVLTAAGFQTP
nr:MULTISPECIES: molybdate ABC transporter substrate-binding protein [unclassified Actinoplanes]